MKARREMTQAGFEFRAKTQAGAGLEDDVRVAAIVECASELSQPRGERCESPAERKAIRRAKAHPFKQTQPDGEGRHECLQTDTCQASQAQCERDFTFGTNR